ncbi:exported hypothetical protein [Cupriavidus phytorum]|uniref:Uncharacterized protein n=1 Tax=Cupriavidus taiwanensis TaxID=164546 RepID=A0A375CK62_9BURK|nr:exported hypothetical protein [Cupriavidus taiwanensis]
MRRSGLAFSRVFATIRIASASASYLAWRYASPLPPLVKDIAINAIGRTKLSLTRALIT